MNAMTTSPTLTPSSNASALAARLHPPAASIGGEWHDDADGEIQVVEPLTGGVFTTVPQTPDHLVRAAVQAARSAFDDGPWPRMSPAERSQRIHRLADLI